MASEPWITPNHSLNMILFQEMIPYNFFTYSISLSGKRIYIIGAANQLSITNDLRAIRKLTLLELDLETKKVKNYKLELGEFADEVLEFYFLAKDLAVMLTYDHRKTELVQYRMQIDKIKLEVCCDCIRHVKFEGPIGIRVGVGAVTHGYVLIIGKTLRELGEVCKIKMIASDPKYQNQFQDFDLDRPIIDLEQKAQMHPEELYLWPKSVPLLHNNSIYFLLAKKEGFSLIFDSFHLGCLIYNPKANNFEPHIRGIDNSEIKALSLHPDMNINYGCMIAQKGKTMWLTFVSPASPRHWRWKVQMFATVVCHAFLFVFGRFFIWFGQYDGGYMATKFMHFYLWLMGPTLIPELGPSPTFRLAALDLEKFKLKVCKFKVRKSALSRFGQVLIDCDHRGDLVMTEMPPRCDDILIHKVPNPFEPRPLCRITKAKVESEFPRLFLEKRLPPYLLQSRSSTVLVPTWNLSTLLK